MTKLVPTHDGYVVSETFLTHIKKCADIFGVPENQKENYLKNLTDSLKKVHETHEKCLPKN